MKDSFAYYHGSYSRRVVAIVIHDTETLSELSYVLDEYLAPSMNKRNSRDDCKVEDMIRGRVIDFFGIFDIPSSRDLRDWQVWFRESAKTNVDGGDKVEAGKEDKKVTIPDDLIPLKVAIKDYDVSRATLKRDIEKGKLRSYRDKNTCPHRISRTKVQNMYPRRQITVEYKYPSK